MKLLRTTNCRGPRQSHSPPSLSQVRNELYISFIQRLPRALCLGRVTRCTRIICTQEVLGRFGCEAVTAAAEQLREITNLYVVPPENLTSLMEQGMLAEMETEVC